MEIIPPVYRPVENASISPTSTPTGSDSGSRPPSGVIQREPLYQMQIDLANNVDQLTKVLADNPPNAVEIEKSLKLADAALKTVNVALTKLNTPFGIKETAQPSTTFKQIAAGAVKAVYESRAEAAKNLVYYIPLGGTLDKAEIDREVTFAQELKGLVYENDLKNLLSKEVNSGNIVTQFDKQEVNTYASIIKRRFPSVEDFVRALNSKAPMPWKEAVNPKAATHIDALLKDWSSPEMHRLVESGAFLALDIRESSQLITGKKAYVTQKGWGDLEEAIKVKAGDLEKAEKKLKANTDPTKREKLERDVAKLKLMPPLSFTQTPKLALQLIKATRDLHEAGFCHGDPKAENVLIFQEEGKWVAKLSDWGKKAPAPNADQVTAYKGNMRYAAPEQTLSRSSDIYGLGLILIRTLEEEFLQGDTKMLIDPADIGKESKEKAEALVKDKERRGVERFVSTNIDCPQRDTDLHAKVRRLSMGFITTIKNIVPQTTTPQRQKTLLNDPVEIQVHGYIDKLERELLGKYTAKEGVIRPMMMLLRGMTATNPADRPPAGPLAESWESLVEQLKSSS